MASSTTQNVGTIVFGITATLISAITVWQGHRAWKIWRERHDSADGGFAGSSDCYTPARILDRLIQSF